MKGLCDCLSFQDSDGDKSDDNLVVDVSNEVGVNTFSLWFVNTDVLSSYRNLQLWDYFVTLQLCRDFVLIQLILVLLPGSCLSSRHTTALP